MKRIPATLGALSLLLLLTVASCTSTLSDEPTTDARAITFTPAADTRAAVTGSEDMGDFQVWGWYDGDGTAAPNNVFDGTVVYKDAGWNYTDGVRYWKAGETYNFYAVYPTDVKANVSSEGTITVTNFDCSKTGTEAVDLMTATATGITYTAEQTPQPVAMKFSHLLSKVNIVATVEGGNATVTKIVFAGMATSGDYSSTGVWNNTQKSNFTKETDQILNAEGIDLLGDMLLIPQDVSGFTVTVDYTMDGEEQSSKTVTLPTAISQWQAGQSYKYTLTFKGDNIIFTVNVAAWNHSTGGIITVE